MQDPHSSAEAFSSAHLRHQRDVLLARSCAACAVALIALGPLVCGSRQPPAAGSGGDREDLQQPDRWFNVPNDMKSAFVCQSLNDDSAATSCAPGWTRSSDGTKCFKLFSERSEDTDVPMYDFVTSRRCPNKKRRVNAADVVIVEGILVLHIKEIVDRCNMKVFVDTPDDTRLARRIRRDTVERGRDVESVLDQYTRFVKPAFEAYVLPSKANADVIIPWQDDRPVAVDLITQHVRMKLSQDALGRIFPNLDILPSTMQTRGMHTVIRNKDTTREDFVFYTDRLCRLAIEAALALLPFSEKQVETPTGALYCGVSWTAKLCGVSVIRSGEAMENALRACCAGIPIGKILCRKHGGGMVWQKLPHDIRQRHVLLMDPVMCTGSSASGAIEALTQQHGVDEGSIVFLTLVAAPESIRRVCSRFPRLKVIVSEIDSGIGPDGLVTPGVGDFGDRYFGTVAGMAAVNGVGPPSS